MNKWITILSAMMLAASASAADVVLADFEGQSYGKWTVEGEAFGKVPYIGGSRISPRYWLGKGLASTEPGKTKNLEGSLTSPEFKVTGSSLSFLIAGGTTDKTALQLIVDGKVAASQSGYGGADSQRGTILLKRSRIDLRPYAGKMAQIRIIDQETGNFGWIAVDDIRMTSDIVIEDFESGTFDNWKIEGDAFGDKPASNSPRANKGLLGYDGIYLANSRTRAQGDKSTGRLTGKPFTIERDYICAKISGGGWDNTRVELLVGGEIVGSMSGWHTENLEGGVIFQLFGWKNIDVRKLKGKEAQIRLVDDRTVGPFGHIAVDGILQTDKPYGDVTGTGTIKISKKCLLFPTKSNARYRNLMIAAGEKTVRGIGLELGGPDHDFYTWFDASRFKGQELTLTMPIVPEQSWMDTIIESDDLPDDLYKEKYRPLFHFTASRGWHNDPNGLYFFKGEWHMLFQNNPFGIMHDINYWGHAISTDLVHWKQIDHAIGGGVGPGTVITAGSGGGFVDWKNRTGYQTGDEPPQVLAISGSAPFCYSNDRGRTWTLDEKRIFRQEPGWGGRDPKVFWYEYRKGDKPMSDFAKKNGGHWVLIIFSSGKYEGEAEKRSTHALHISDDFDTWQFASRNDGFYECPELFDIPLDGDPAKMKWVMYDNKYGYQVGDFDGYVFTPETKHRRINAAGKFAASQLFSDVPETDGRRICVGWMKQVKFPGMPFCQQMNFPVELTLRSTEEEPRLFVNPAREIDKIHEKGIHLEDVTLTPESENPLAKARGKGMHLKVEIEPGNAKQINFMIRGYDDRGQPGVRYDVETQTLFVQGETKVPLIDRQLKLNMLIDVSSIEIYANDGAVFLSKPHHVFDPERDDIDISVVGGEAKFNKLDFWPIESMWLSK